MKFRTEVKISPFKHPIALTEKIVALGSCFASELAEALASRNLRVLCNPLGPLYNPLSIASAIERAVQGKTFTAEEIATNREGDHFSFDASTHFTDPSCEELLTRLNATNNHLRDALHEADRIILTFGTAWVYRLAATNEVVANCHKEPATTFRRERLSVSEIVERWKALLQGPLADKQIILTLSPIRHLGDGLDGNAISKATLRLAIEELASACPNVTYFAAYELLLDDLRDYRFYAEDLVHPSRQAVTYILERFTEAAFTALDRAYLARIERALAFCHHRPTNPQAVGYRQGVKQTLVELRALEEEAKIDFSAQIQALEALL